MNVFVTGGAGYVGSHCVKRLIEGGHRVTVFDNLSGGHRAAVHASADFIEGDLSDAAGVAAALGGQSYDAVMHFAAFLNVGESVSQPLKYYRNNVVGTLNLLDGMYAAGIRGLVFSSTCAVYGIPDELPITEDLPKSPINPYGATKLAVERMLADSTGWGLGSIALRYFNAAGAAADGSLGEDHDPELHLIPLVLRVAAGKSESIGVFGTDYPTPDGSCVRDYIHVEDLAEAHLLAVEACRPGEAEAFNVGVGVGTSVLEVIEAARRITGRPIPLKLGARRPGDPPTLYADPGRIMQRLNWSPRYRQIDETIATAWRWHASHPDGYAEEE